MSLFVHSKEDTQLQGRSLKLKGIENKHNKKITSEPIVVQD